MFIPFPIIIKTNKSKNVYVHKLDEAERVCRISGDLLRKPVHLDAIPKAIVKMLEE